jgi:hypothetical protein
MGSGGVSMNKELSQEDIDEVMFGIEQEVYDMGRNSLCSWAIKGMSNYYLNMSRDELLESGWITESEEKDESSNVQYKYKTIDESGEHPEYPFGIEWSSDLEGVLIDHIKWYETEEERDRIFNESEALDALKIMESKNE